MLKSDEILTKVPDTILVVESCDCGSLTKERDGKNLSLAAITAEFSTFNLMTNMEDPCSKICSFKTTSAEVEQVKKNALG